MSLNYPVAEMTAEMGERYRSIAMANYEFWKATCSAEDAQKAKDQNNALKENPAAIAEVMAEIASDFASCDTDGDSRLNLEEYRAFLAAAKARADAKGQWYSRPDTYAEDTYALYNGMNPECDGFTHEQWMSYMGKFMAIYREIAAADGQQV